MNPRPYFNLASFKQLCGESFIESLIIKRKKSGEISRERLIGTLEILWLIMGVAAYSHLSSLVEIIHRVQAQNFFSTHR